MWNQFKELIFLLLRQIEGFVGDWGLAIIALTVLMRLALMPLTLKQTKSMYELQRIQPKIKELQQRYADDKEKLQEETLKFYQDNKVNPFGGCLPAILQMPIFIALYGVVGQTQKGPGLMISYLERTGEIGRFFSLIPDISKSPSMVYQADGIAAAIPYLVLVLLFGLSIWLPQALMPGEKQQKMMGAYMGAIFLFFGWSAPAGVLLYWDASSLLGVAQQQLQLAQLRRHDDRDEVVIEPPAKTEKKAPPKKKSGKKK